MYPALIKNLVKIGRFDDAIDVCAEIPGRDSSSISSSAKRIGWSGQKDAAIQALRTCFRGLRAQTSRLRLRWPPSPETSKHWRKRSGPSASSRTISFWRSSKNCCRRPVRLSARSSFVMPEFTKRAFYNKAAEEALKVLEPILANLDALMTIGTAYQRLGRIDDAPGTWSAPRRISPAARSRYSRLANLASLRQRKDPGNRRSSWISAVKLDPGNAGYLYNLGWMYEQIGDVNPRPSIYTRRAIRSKPAKLRGDEQSGIDLRRRAASRNGRCRFSSRRYVPIRRMKSRTSISPATTCGGATGARRSKTTIVYSRSIR